MAGLLFSLDHFGLPDWLMLLVSLGPLSALTIGVYNLFFHPLSHIPGPLWARVSGIPSWYHAYHGDRHVWLWQLFQTYGDRIRPEPDTVLFCDPEAYADIYSVKSNVRRSRFYEALKRNKHESTTLTTIDVAEHARRRRRLNLCFTEKSIRAASEFIVKHVDRWIDIIVDEIDGTTGWSASMDFSDRVDGLIFDIMADLSFGKSFDIKEPGDSYLKATPHNIAEYMKFYYLMCRSPFLKLLLWLKPRGLDWLLELIAPPAAQQYTKFVQDSVTERIALQKLQADKPENERRQDLFYFVAEARDEAGRPAYNELELHAESSLLIVAGSDTTAVSLSALFFYLTGDPQRCQKLASEIRSAFDRAEDIVYGPELMRCTYLRACVDESLRLTPTSPSDLPREIRAGGMKIKGQYYPPGTIVGTVPWASSRDAKVYGDADVFRPERWILGEGATEDELKRAKAGFHPFLSGQYNCVGQNLAMAEVLITVARTLHRLDVRRTPGSTLGGGKEARDKNQFQLVDAYVSFRKGPEVQFRKSARAV
ncbi:benzoate 4-monooxygenase cytochrome P450 [Biscogniauxia mediterranea]|nr:benzoate 4-monooxygenase cytochrome P450 [Biscogniauxia mediterranea]